VELLGTSGRTLYASLPATRSGFRGSRPAGITGFDTDTGKAVWHHELPSNKRSCLLVDGVLIHQDGTPTAITLPHDV